MPVTYFIHHFFTLSCLGILVVNCAPHPIPLVWSSKHYGPDGPWQAITISIGNPPQPVDLIPGGSWPSNVFAPSICNNITLSPVCFGQTAGFYDPFSSTTPPFNFSGTGKLVNGTFIHTDGAISINGSALPIFDHVSVPFDGSFGSTGFDNFDMLMVTDGYYTLPDGTTYPATIGKLSLGAQDANQSWSEGAGLPAYNATFIPSYLYSSGQTLSNSFGLHIGSTSMGMSGSLWIGGYDQERVLGPVSTQAYEGDDLPIDLLDIGIGVAEGQSPFAFESKSDLLRQGNSSIGNRLSVHVDAVDPYLYLPQSTCDAIAQDLPVTYQSKYGLYFWNTSDPRYKQIVTSPSYLSFTFSLNRSITQNFTINVPFSLLNLTLTAPLTTTPTQYFPCTHFNYKGFALGRAFLQAAFLGVNWSQENNGPWFLAQAPGPNIPSLPQATNIHPEDLSITGSTAAWVDTWQGFWTPIAATNTSSSMSSPSSSPSSGNSQSTGLSTGAKAGIGVGVTIAALLIIAAGIFFYRRRVSKRNGQITQPPMSTETQRATMSGMSPGKYQHAGWGPRELDSRYAEGAGDDPPGGIAELEGRYS